MRCIPFQWGCLPLKSYSIEASSIKFVFYLRCLPLRLSSFTLTFIDVVFHYGLLPLRSYSNEAVFHLCLLPLRLSSIFSKTIQRSSGLDLQLFLSKFSWYWTASLLLGLAGQAGAGGYKITANSVQLSWSWDWAWQYTGSKDSIDMSRNYRRIYVWYRWGKYATLSPSCSSSWAVLALILFRLTNPKKVPQLGPCN